MFVALAAGRSVADEPIEVITSVRDSAERARGLIHRGQPDEAIRALRLIQRHLREGEPTPATAEWDRRVQKLLILAVREEERIEAKEAARRGDAPILRDEQGQGREGRLRREFGRVMAQVADDGGAGGGTGGIGGGGGIAVGPGGAVGFAAIPGFIGVGPSFGVVPVVSADRRYVRLGMNPIFLSNLSFARFPVFGAAGGS